MSVEEIRMLAHVAPEAGAWDALREVQLLRAKLGDPDVLTQLVRSALAEGTPVDEVARRLGTLPDVVRIAFL